MRAPALLLALALAGCDSFAPTGAVPFPNPPVWYRAVWDSAQACTGRHGDFDQLRFFVIPNDTTFLTPKGEAGGWTVGHDITFADRWARTPWIVKHEMIHALGVHDHPYHPFTDPCNAMPY